MIDEAPLFNVFDPLHDFLHYMHVVERLFERNIVVPAFDHPQDALFVRQAVVKDFFLDRHRRRPYRPLIP